MNPKKKSKYWSDQRDFTLESRLHLAGIPQFGPNFIDKVLKGLQKTGDKPASIWSGLTVFGRPILVSASMVTLIILLLHLVFADPINTDIFELTDLSFNVMVADAVH